MQFYPRPTSSCLGHAGGLFGGPRHQAVTPILHNSNHEHRDGLQSSKAFACLTPLWTRTDLLTSSISWRPAGGASQGIDHDNASTNNLDSLTSMDDKPCGKSSLERLLVCFARAINIVATNHQSIRQPLPIHTRMRGSCGRSNSIHEDLSCLGTSRDWGAEACVFCSEG